VGGARADIVVEAGGAFFVAPDNGLVSLAARGPRLAYSIARPELMRAPVSPTFHGRDVLAAAAGQLASGAHPREFGPVLDAIADLARGEGGLQAVDAAVIVHVDRFGNLITSLQPNALAHDLLMPGTRLVCTPDGREPFPARAGRTYADVSHGEMVVYVGSAGFVEIAVREGSAAATTGLRRGQAVRLRRAPR
jgi:S-adenosylmethionine hydrolase